VSFFLERVEVPAVGSFKSTLTSLTISPKFSSSGSSYDHDPPDFLLDLGLHSRLYVTLWWKVLLERFFRADGEPLSFSPSPGSFIVGFRAFPAPWMYLCCEELSFSISTPVFRECDGHPDDPAFAGFANSGSSSSRLRRLHFRPSKVVGLLCIFIPGSPPLITLWHGFGFYLLGIFSIFLKSNGSCLFSPISPLRCCCNPELRRH